MYTSPHVMSTRAVFYRPIDGFAHGKRVAFVDVPNRSIQNYFPLCNLYTHACVNINVNSQASEKAPKKIC
jgi:hypothetical protein